MEGKIAASWLDFLFDESGESLRKHLEDDSAEPGPMQLIVQFLERAKVPANNSGGSVTENPRAQRLHLLALMVAFHLEWNLQILEESLPLQWQHLLFSALVSSGPDLQGFSASENILCSLDQRNALIAIIYYRWVVRTFAQNLSSINQLGNGGLADAAATESVMKLLQEQLPSAVKALEEAQSLPNDLELPEPTLKVERKKTHDGMVSGEACNGYTANSEEKMEVCPGEPIVSGRVMRVTKEEVIAQVAFDLGTLYFYQEKFEDAKRLFASCANFKCPKSSFCSIDRERLQGFCDACCGLLGSTTPDRPSLVVQLRNCAVSNLKDIIPILTQDNISLELPMECRRSLVLELQDSDLPEAGEADEPASVPIRWQAAACNAIRDIVEGRVLEAAFWASLKNCTTPQMECFLSLCSRSVSMKMETSQEDQSDESLARLRSFVRFLCSSADSVDAWAILNNSEAKSVLFSTEELLGPGLVRKSRKSRKTRVEWTSGEHMPSFQVGQDNSLQIGLLQLKLRASFEPDEISNLLEELHKLDKGRKHSEHLVCLVYKSYFDDITEPVLHDLLHVLFSKAAHCFSLQEYSAAGNLLAYGLGRMSDVSSRAASPAAVERVRAALQQELLLLDIAQDQNCTRSEEITSKVNSHLWQSAQTKPHDLKPHVDAKMMAHLLNCKQWELLSELRVDETADNLAVGYRLLGRLVGATCCSLSKPQVWRRAARTLWDGVCQIFSATGQQKRPQDGGVTAPVHRGLSGINMSNFTRFTENLLEETSLSVIISCLVKLHCASSEDESECHTREMFSTYNHLWPTTITNRSLLNAAQVVTALSAVVKHAVSVQPCNPSWLHTMGDLYIASSNYSAALKCFLEAGAAASLLFTTPVPSSTWDEQVYKKMIVCCSALKAHIQAAVLCQCTEPVDYTTAFKAVQQAALTCEDAMDYYYDFFWDVTILEYIVHTHAKRGQSDKKQVAVEAISQPELNIFNNPEVLEHSGNRRKSSFFRAMAKQYL